MKDEEGIESVLIRPNALSIYDRNNSGIRMNKSNRQHNKRFRKELIKQQGMKLKIHSFDDKHYRCFLQGEGQYIIIHEMLVQSLFYSVEHTLFHLRKILKSLLKSCRKSECGSQYKSTHHDCNKIRFAEFMVEYIDMGRAFLLHWDTLYRVEFAVKKDINLQMDIMHQVYPYFLNFYGEGVWDVLRDFQKHECIQWLYKQKETNEIRVAREIKRSEEAKKGKEVFDKLSAGEK